MDKSNKLLEIIKDIKIVQPNLTNEEAQLILESMKTYCEIIIDIYMDEVAHNEQIQHE
jgi:hypothetical protein